VVAVMRDVAYAVTLAILIVLCVALWPRHGRAHDPYTDWLSPKTGWSCCHDRDCRPVRAWLDDRGLWHARVGGRQVIVPPDIVLDRVAPDGGSHICINPTGELLCFVGGVPKS